MRWHKSLNQRLTKLEKKSRLSNRQNVCFILNGKADGDPNNSSIVFEFNINTGEDMDPKPIVDSGGSQSAVSDQDDAIAAVITEIKEFLQSGRTVEEIARSVKGKFSEREIQAIIAGLPE
jgi:hypothetical protein